MTTSAAIVGGCLCGEVRFRVEGPVLHADHCHCALCRRASGAPFTPWMTVPLPAFRVESGSFAAYRSTPGAERGFCRRCGGTLTFRLDGEDEVDIALGAVDDPAAIPRVEHIWATSALPWIRVDPDLPVRDGHGPWAPAPEAPAGAGDRLDGGCLCGRVRYAVTGLPTASAICHCGLCRRGTGGFCSARASYPRDRFAPLSGQTVGYRASDTGTRHFCGYCGSHLWIEPDRAGDSMEILIPTLDAADRLSPEAHAFWASRPAGTVYDDRRPRFPGPINEGEPSLVE